MTRPCEPHAHEQHQRSRSTKSLPVSFRRRTRRWSRPPPPRSVSASERPATPTAPSSTPAGRGCSRKLEYSPPDTIARCRGQYARADSAPTCRTQAQRPGSTGRFDSSRSIRYSIRGRTAADHLKAANAAAGIPVVSRGPACSLYRVKLSFQHRRRATAVRYLRRSPIRRSAPGRSRAPLSTDRSPCRQVRNHVSDPMRISSAVAVIERW